MTDSDTQQLIRTYQRRLAVLERQFAAQGLHTPPAIITEIEDIRIELSRVLVRDFVLEETRPVPFPGLILLIGPGRIGQKPSEQSAQDAIDFHRVALRFCWLISSIEAQPFASNLQRYCESYGIQADIQTIDDAWSVQPTYDLVNQLYWSSVPQANLKETEAIADVTGATKPMSFGMLLACGMGRPMQYMVRRSGDQPSIPILLHYKLNVKQA